MLPGVLLLLMNEESRIAFAQYISVRALQCLYNAGVIKYYQGDKQKAGENSAIVPTQGIPNLDAFLFAGSTGFILYAYILRPSALEHTYRAFLQTLGRVHPKNFEAISSFLRMGFFHIKPLVDFASPKSLLSPEALYDEIFKYKDIVIPCHTIHPHEPSCLRYDFQVGLRGAKLALPMYLSLHTLTTLLFRWPQFIPKWKHYVWTILKNSTQSTIFLSSLCVTIHAFVCGYRVLLRNGWISWLVKRDQKIFYWLAGAIPGFACIFIEKQQRRLELALYV